MHSKSFETRSTASIALSQIFSLTPLWQPESLVASDPNASFPVPEYPNFSVRELVLQGKLLLASSGKEFVKPAGILSSSAEVKKARKEAMNRLGLEFLDNVADDMDLEKEFADTETDGDVDMEAVSTKLEDGSPSMSPMDVCPPTAAEGVKNEIKAPSRSLTPAEPTPITPTVSEPDLSTLSARERNRLKRKRKPGNSAFVAAPPPQSSGSRYTAAASGPSK